LQGGARSGDDARVARETQVVVRAEIDAADRAREARIAAQSGRVAALELGRELLVEGRVQRGGRIARGRRALPWRPSRTLRLSTSQRRKTAKDATEVTRTA